MLPAGPAHQANPPSNQRSITGGRLLNVCHISNTHISLQLQLHTFFFFSFFTQCELDLHLPFPHSVASGQRMSCPKQSVVPHSPASSCPKAEGRTALPERLLSWSAKNSLRHTPQYQGFPKFLTFVPLPPACCAGSGGLWEP